MSKNNYKVLRNRIERIVMSQAGVCYSMGKPGIGKTALHESIADEAELLFIDLRLAQIDSAEVGGIPKAFVDETDIGNGVIHKEHYFKYCLPNWAIRANKSTSLVNPKTGLNYKGALIFFDELNRASLETRNAALQILNEKKIGDEFKFEPHVYMAAAGNLGEEDGTEVEEFDTALWNRLIGISFNITLNEWKEAFANNNVHPLIIEFLDSRSEFFWKREKDQKDKAFATPRSWTNLSKLAGKDADIDRLYEDVMVFGPAYIGAAAANKFKSFLDDRRMLSLKDILNDWDAVKDMAKKMNRSRRSEIIGEAKKIVFCNLDKSSAENLLSFMEICDTDEVAAYAFHVVENEMKVNASIPKNLILFKERFETILRSVLQKFKEKKAS